MLESRRFYSGVLLLGQDPLEALLADAACLQSSCWTLHVRLIRTELRSAPHPGLAATDGWLSLPEGLQGRGDSRGGDLGPRVSELGPLSRQGCCRSVVKS